MLIDTHAHLDGEEFRDDLDDVMARAAAAGVEKVLLPAIDLASAESVVAVCKRFPGRAYPMIGLHPEEVKADWQAVLAKMHELLLARRAADEHPWIAIGEVGLDYYWSREFADEQLLAFEEQVRWSVETRLPLMIHCRKAQNEMVTLLKRYRSELPGGVFHCFTGNALEAEQLLQFDNFMLGIGGVSTFKKSHLPEVLPQVVPLSRIVLETDAPYMAPVPHRGKRNESAFVVEVADKLAQSYGTTPDEVARITTDNAKRMFGLA